MRNNNLFENTKYYIENNDVSKNWRTERSIRYTCLPWGHKISLLDNNYLYITFFTFDNYFLYTAANEWTVESIDNEFFDKDTMENRIYFIEKIKHMKLGLANAS